MALWCQEPGLLQSYYSDIFNTGLLSCGLRWLLQHPPAYLLSGRKEGEMEGVPLIFKGTILTFHNQPLVSWLHHV